MKNFLFVCFLLVICGTAGAQNVQVTKGVFVGKNYSNSLSITADVYTFDNEKPFLRVDSANNYFYVLTNKMMRNRRYLTDRGFIYMFDLESGNGLWHRKTNLRWEQVSDCPEGLLISSIYETSFLDPATGEEVWTKKFIARRTCSEKGLMLAYVNSDRKKVRNMLKGVDLATGELLWETYLKYRPHWDEMIFLNDTTLLIASEGLNTVNINDGTGWKYEAKTYTKNYKRAIATTALGIATAAFFGVGVVDTRPTETTGLRSNILIKDSVIYTAGHEKISGIDLRGRVLWETGLPGDGSRSYLRLRNDSLLMLNLGFGHRNGKKSDVGRPFVACFNKDNGNMVFHYPLAKEGFPVRDLITAYDGIYLMVDDGICHLKPDHSGYSFKAWDVEVHDKLSGFIQYALVYDPTSHSFREIDSSKEGSRVVYDEKRALFETNGNFEIIRALDPSEVYTTYGNWGEYKLISNPGSPLCLFDGEGKMVAVIDLDHRSVEICKDKLFVIAADYCLYTIDLNQLKDDHFLNTK